jgi:glyoxylase-like metal-dependent hydrolase (beta-lactamase superfamily II)
VGLGRLLPGALAALGVRSDEVDTVVCSHPHLDHVGWLVHDGRPFFPNATVRYGSGDWDQFVAGADAAGVTARHTPGHTLGHYCLVLSSGDRRAFVLGDAVECPLQLEEPDFYTLSDVDPALAARSRESLWRELEGTADLVGGAHFPGLQLGRVLAGQGRRWFVS